MQELVVIRIKSLIGNSNNLYWNSIEDNWTAEKESAQKIPKDIAVLLAEYLRWEGFEVDLELAS